MNILNKNEAAALMNHFAENKKPFIFISDFEMINNHVISLDEVDPEYIMYDFNGVNNVACNSIELHSDIKTAVWNVSPVTPQEYAESFNHVINGLKRGDSFLVNLTARSRVTTDLSLKEIFIRSKAKYKLYIKDRFCSLSPESFVTIKDRKISSYPMKGTIDADIPEADRIIMDDIKEKAEHATIVDLIRNDLGICSLNVEVERYRYIDKLKTNVGNILQVSSKISGFLPDNLADNIGDIIFSMLPAGSISGAPKKKTIEIIRTAEGKPRGYYTGVAGIYDGNNLDSAVLIRSIETDGVGNMTFQSGGGITAKSDMKSEYEELIRKVYLPV